MFWLLKQDPRRKAIAAALLLVFAVGDLAYRLIGHAMTSASVLAAMRGPLVAIPLLLAVVLALSSQFSD